MIIVNFNRELLSMPAIQHESSYRIFQTTFEVIIIGLQSEVSEF